MANKKGSTPKKDKGEIVLGYLAKYPAWFPHNSLAEIIYQENKHSFNDKESARNLVRYYRAKKGDRARAELNRGGSGQFKELYTRKSIPFAMPETWAEEKKIYHIPVGYKKAGLISDLQVPFHCPKAIDICFDYLTKVGVDHLIINGDLADFYHFSDFEKDPTKRDFEVEYNSILEMLFFVKASFPNIPIYYNLDANHERRYERYMRVKAPLLLKVTDMFDLEDLFHLDEIGIIPIHNFDHIKFGKLPIIHGDTVFRFGSGVNPAKRLFDKTMVSCIASHIHRTHEFTGKNFNGEMSTCWTIGMLAHPNVEYCKHVDQYNQGFAILEKELSGDYEVENKRIYKNKVR